MKPKLKNWQLLAPLPDLFTKEDGTRISTKEEWEERRKEIYALAIDMQYGGMPPEPEFLDVEPLYNAGRASSYRIHTGRKDHPFTFIMQIVWANEKVHKAPFIVDGDGCFPYVYLDDNLKTITEAGISLVRFNRVELAHDIKEPTREDGIYAVYPDTTFSALAAWAWGYHRCTDAMFKLGLADENTVIAYTGHSRGGKTALIAGATDTRATITNPNGSGAGGAGCYRIHSETDREDGTVQRSEELADLLRNFPFWFGPKMPEYAQDETKIPFDEHFTKALVCPRILLDTEALSDGWANPVGTYMTHQAVKEAYKFFGAEENALIHYRLGFHYHKPEDVAILVNVIKHVTDGTPLDETINKTPFDNIPAVHEWKCPEC